jgi:hypothetical protein
MALDLTVEHLEALAPFFRGKEGVRGTSSREKFQTAAVLISNHFEQIASTNHPCRVTMELALEMLKGKPSKIIETGSAAWGTKSTLLFDSYVNSFGGSLKTVDIRVEPLYTLSRICSGATTVYCDDSVNFLQKLTKTERYDLIYLDAFDLDPTNPIPSMVHGLNEFLLVLPVLLNFGGLLLIDDTPNTIEKWCEVQGETHREFLTRFTQMYDILPGKGGLVKQVLGRYPSAQVVAHGYQLLIEFKS